MKFLIKALLLPIVCLSLLVASVALAEESLEDIRKQAELGDAAAQFVLGSAYYKVQTSAVVPQGSSGGGLFDAEGNLIGIVTSKFTDEGMEGIAFAIPADLVLEL